MRGRGYRRAVGGRCSVAHRRAGARRRRESPWPRRARRARRAAAPRERWPTASPSPAADQTWGCERRGGVSTAAQRRARRDAGSGASSWASSSRSRSAGRNGRTPRRARPSCCWPPCPRWAAARSSRHGPPADMWTADQRSSRKATDHRARSGAAHTNLPPPPRRIPAESPAWSPEAAGAWLGRRPLPRASWYFSLCCRSLGNRTAHGRVGEYVGVARALQD